MTNAEPPTPPPPAPPGPPRVSNGKNLMDRLLLTRGEVAEVLGVPVASVDYLHRMERLRGVQVGKMLRWKPSTVQEFVDGLEPG